MGLHFLASWLCGPSFPCILALWAFISLHFGLVGLYFLAFWPFRGQLLGPPPQVAKNGPFAQPTSLQWIYQGRNRLHFAIFSLPGLYFLAFWPCGPSFHCILVGLYFRAFWLCGPSFPCILALWAFISLHFGLVGLHFLAFWPFRGQLLGPPPQVAKNGPFAQRPYNGFIRAVTGSILQFLAFRAFISLYFGLVGLHFLAFWPCGPSFPCILTFSGSASGPPPQVAKNGPFAQRPYNGFIRAVTGSILQFLAFRAFISLHFGLVGLYFLAFWPCGLLFPCILALWAFISVHFGLVGLYFLAFWPFRGQLLGSPPQVAKNCPFAQRPYNGFIRAVTGSILQFFSLLGLHFLAFWPCGPSFPCILAL